MLPIDTESSLLYAQRYPESNHSSWFPLLTPWCKMPLCDPGYCIGLLLRPSPCSCPFTSYRPFSAGQLIPFSKVRPCHSFSQNPPKVCQRGTKATSFLDPTRHQQSDPTSTPLPLAHFCFSHTGLLLLCGDHANYILPQGLCTGCSVLLKCCLISIWPSLAPPKPRGTPAQPTWPGLPALPNTPP